MPVKMEMLQYFTSLRYVPRRSGRQGRNSEFYTYPQSLISGEAVEEKKCEKINYVYKKTIIIKTKDYETSYYFTPDYSIGLRY